jgi:hypothetical protein
MFKKMNIVPRGTIEKRPSISSALSFALGD